MKKKNKWQPLFGYGLTFYEVKQKIKKIFFRTCYYFQGWEFSKVSTSIVVSRQKC